MKRMGAQELQIRRGVLAGALLAAFTLLGGSAARAQAPAYGGTIGDIPTSRQTRMSQRDRLAANVRLEQKMNAPAPADVSFRDETGKAVKLGDYFGKKPVMLIMIQLRCTMLCTEEMNVLVNSLNELKFDPGKQFELVTVSIDPRETPDLAAEQKAHYLKDYPRAAGKNWHFLTGDEANIKRLADAVGFHYVYDKQTDQYAHPDGVMILTPKGNVARYYMNLNYAAQGLRFGLIEAAENKIGNPLDAIALLCYHYDPATGQYSVALLKVVRLASIFTVIGLLGGIFMMKKRDRLSRRRVGDSALEAEG
jgi:protein SCO1/2